MIDDSGVDPRLPPAVRRSIRTARAEGTAWPDRIEAIARLDRFLLDTLRAAASGRDEAARSLCRSIGLRRSIDGTDSRPWPSLRAELLRRLTAWPRRSLAEARRSPSKLVLARSLLEPRVVVDEIRRRLRRSAGIGRTLRGSRGVAAAEADRALAELPEFERRIARGLLESREVFWRPLEASPDDLPDDLVECPEGTVVLVVRPPASDWELELKRAGLAGERVLSIVETPVPTHRLAGGSSVQSLEAEAAASACFAAAWRRLRREESAASAEAPVSRTLDLRVVLKVPAADGKGLVADHLTDHFTAAVAADGDLRRSLTATLESFAREGRDVDSKGASDFARVTAFLQQLPPAQSCLVGTSAHRLDRVAERFGRDAEHGFRAVRTPPAPDLALDDLLSLALDGVEPADSRGLDPVGSTLAAHREPAHRIAARLLDQVAVVWGTLLGLGGHSHGESLVGRNVGLRRRWRDGRPRVELVFMDHDNLDLPPPSAVPELDESLAVGLAGARKDELAVFGGSVRGRSLEGVVELIERIYRLSPTRCDRGRERFDDLLVATCRATRRALRAGLEGLFHPELADVLDARDRLLLGFLDEGTAGDPARDESLRPYAAFLRRRRRLFEPARGPARESGAR